MVVYDFDVRFTFVLAGWPGLVHDMRVFNDAIINIKYADKFPHPPEGKYYLVDSGYPNRLGYLAPYKGTKYYIQEFHLGTMSRGMKEAFNYAHSSIRNHVERSFGVFKQKWRIMYGIPSFPLAKQSKIIVAYMALHNFVRDHDEDDQDFNLLDQDEEYYEQGQMQDAAFDSNEGNEAELLSDETMNEFRDRIVHALYNNH